MDSTRKVSPAALVPFAILTGAALMTLSSCGEADLASFHAAASEPSNEDKRQRHDDEKKFKAKLRGVKEVPAVSTCARGEFWAQLKDDRKEVEFKLTYADLEGEVLQAHIHFGQKSVNGGIAVFLCTNLGNGPAGTQECPPPPATVTGTFRADDVIGPEGQGISAGQFEEVIRAMRKGATYANVHSAKFPGGEIRGQLRKVDDRHRDDHGRDGNDRSGYADGEERDHGMDGREKDCAPDPKQ